MVKIAVDTPGDNCPSSATHQTVQRSSAISRKSLRKPKANIAKPVEDIKPAKTTKPIKIIEPEKSARSVKPVKSSVKSPKIAKDRAVKSALRSVATIKEEPTPIQTKHKKSHRFLLALVCSAATVAGLTAFINFNMPNISVKVAAMQSGIEAAYPTYIPRNYQLSNVTSDKNGKITMVFSGLDNNSFTLSEERSTWDSNALLSNYIKKNNSEYSTLREQGITIYTYPGGTAWVNGGILYEITTTGRNLTKEQIRNLVVSL